MFGFKRYGFLVIFLLAVLFVWVGIGLTAHRAEAKKVLFKSNFSDLAKNWEILDDPDAKRSPGKWRFGLADFSGIYSRDQAIATALLGGEKDWSYHTVKTSLHMASSQGYLVGIILKSIFLKQWMSLCAWIMPVNVCVSSPMDV